MDGEIQQIAAESQAGYCVDTEDYKALAEAVIKMYSLSVEQRQTMGENAKNYYFQNFERNLNMRKLEDYIFAG